MTSNQARKPIIIKKKETGKYNRRIGYQIKYHDGLGLRYFPNFLSKDEADNLYNTLLHELDWYRVQYPKYGRTIVTPRYTTCFGHDGTLHPTNRKYRYPIVPWPQALLDLKEKLLQEVDPMGRFPKMDFNFTLVNLYEKASDSITWHSDDEKFLGDNPIIASFSLGSKRTFKLKHKTNSAIPQHSFSLEHGSLLMMESSTQHNWLHCIPKENWVEGPRINITMRYAVSWQGTNNYYRYNRGKDDPVVPELLQSESTN